VGVRQGAVEDMGVKPARQGADRGSLPVGRSAAPALMNGFEIADIDQAVENAAPALDEMKAGSLFLTGGTGFFGQWLLALIARANAVRGSAISVSVLTRDAAAFRIRCPDLASQPFFSFIEGDVRRFEFPRQRFTHLIHAAADTSALADRKPLELMDTIVEGTVRVMAFAAEQRPRRTLLVSSGAVYGQQPADLSHIAEDFHGAPDPLDRRSAYGAAKRMAEQIAALHNQEQSAVVVARAFTLAGPGLPLDGHFAIGNFVRDAVAGRPVMVAGDGTPHRSYLHAGDLAAWLLRLLTHGRAGNAYNVGSDRAVSIAELAGEIVRVIPAAAGIRMEGKPSGSLRSRYIPSIDKARRELGLDVWTPLEQSIERMGRWAERRTGISL
jgi:nucleoside-diphosphate-sugar epimerase